MILAGFGLLAIATLSRLTRVASLLFGFPRSIDASEREEP
jgi:hypothetical protein